MDPSPAAIALIRARVADWSPADAAIADTLNAPAIPNPTPQPTVPRPYGFGDVMGCLGAASVANVRSLPTATDLIAKINALDGPGILHWLAALSAPPALIAPAEAAAVAAVLAATQGDPAWPAQLSWAQANLGRPVDLEDVAAARPGGA